MKKLLLATFLILALVSIPLLVFADDSDGLSRGNINIEQNGADFMDDGTERASNIPSSSDFLSGIMSTGVVGNSDLRGTNGTLDGQRGSEGGFSASRQSVGFCPQLTPGLHIGAEGAEVTNLQRFFSQYPEFYPSGSVIGRFGPQTQAAVQAYQRARGIVSSGAWDTTGYGQVGRRTIEAINQDCGNTTPIANTSVSPTQAGTLSAENCTAPTVGGTCAVVTSWTTSPIVPIAVNVVDPITNQFAGGSWVAGVNQTTASQNGSYNFNLKKGSYKFILYGWINAAWVLLQQKTVTVSDPGDVQTCPAGQTGTPPNCVTPGADPTGTITVTDCMPLSGEEGIKHCVIQGYWTAYNTSSDNTSYNPITKIIIIENKNGKLYQNNGYDYGETREFDGENYVQSRSSTGFFRFVIESQSRAYGATSADVTLKLFGAKAGILIPLDQKRSTLSTLPFQETMVRQHPAAGTLTAPDCTTSSVGGTCAEKISWTTENSYRDGYVFSLVKVFDDTLYKPNNLYPYQATAGLLYSSDVNGPYGLRADAGSYTMNLKKGRYRVMLFGGTVNLDVRGYYNPNGTVTLQDRVFTVSDPSVTATCPTGQTGTPPNCMPNSVATPRGTITASRVACQSSTSCYISVDWTSSDSARNGSPISDLGVVTSSNNAPVGGTWISGKNYLITGANGSMTFPVTPGTYTLYLWGWNAAGTQVELDHKGITVTGAETLTCPTGQTGTPPNCTATSPLIGSGGLLQTGATQSLTAAPCTISAGQTSCPIQVSWSGFSMGSPWITVTSPGNSEVQWLSGITGTGRYAFNALQAGTYVFKFYSSSPPLGGPTVLATANVTVGTEAAARATGTLSATGCTTTTAGGSCGVVTSWTTTPVTPIAVNVVDPTTGLFYGGSWVAGVNQTTSNQNGSYTFNLKRGNYRFDLQGWVNNAWVLLGQQSVTVSDPSTTATCPAGQTGTPPNCTTVVTISPNGSTLFPGSGGSLRTAEGTWTFGTQTQSVGNKILLNGVSAANGWGVKLFIDNQGVLNTVNGSGVGWKWINGGWQAVSGGGDGGGGDGSAMITPASSISNLAGALAAFMSAAPTPSTPTVTPRASVCAEIYPGLTVGSQGVAVYQLQQFLARDTSIYPDAEFTGYFGPLTAAAVARFQTREGIVTSGTPETTGYGAVGTQTLAAIKQQCK